MRIIKNTSKTRNKKASGKGTKYKVGFVYPECVKYILCTSDRAEAQREYTRQCDMGTPCRVWVGKRMLLIYEADELFKTRSTLRVTGEKA